MPQLSNLASIATSLEILLLAVGGRSNLNALNQNLAQGGSSTEMTELLTAIRDQIIATDPEQLANMTNVVKLVFANRVRAGRGIPPLTMEQADRMVGRASLQPVPPDAPASPPPSTAFFSRMSLENTVVLTRYAPSYERWMTDLVSSLTSVENSTEILLLAVGGQSNLDAKNLDLAQGGSLTEMIELVTAIRNQLSATDPQQRNNMTNDTKLIIANRVRTGGGMTPLTMGQADRMLGRPSTQSDFLESRSDSDISENKGLSGMQIAGIAVGAVLVLACITVGIVVAVVRSRKEKSGN